MAYYIISFEGDGEIEAENKDDAIRKFQDLVYENKPLPNLVCCMVEIEEEDE